MQIPLSIKTGRIATWVSKDFEKSLSVKLRRKKETVVGMLMLKNIQLSEKVIKSLAQFLLLKVI